MPNALDQLRECSFKGVAFPTTSLKMSLAHDLAQHKYWGVDGAHIEATGRAPLVFHVVIPFRNNIAKSSVESWNNLYPDAYRAFMDAASEKRTGIFVHPEFGEYSVKVQSVESSWDPNKRDGCDVDLVLIETVLPDSDGPVFAASSPIAEGMQAATDLDAALTLAATPLYAQYFFAPNIVRLPQAVYKPDFFESMRQIAGIGDQISLVSKQVAGKISALQYRANAIQSSFSTVAQAKFWPIQDSSDRLNNSLYQLQQKLLQTQQSISHYIVPQRTTLAGVAQDLKAKVSDIIKLNPSLVSSHSVEAMTVVRYYGT